MKKEQDKRNVKGNGNVRQREDGTWEARCVINGKRRSFYADKQSEALKKMRAAQKEGDKGQFLDPNKITVGKWLDIWLEEYSKPSIRSTTYAVRRGTVDVHLKPALGSVKLQSLDPTQVQAFYNFLRTEKKLAPSTINTIHLCLNCCLEQAVRLKYIRENPLHACVLPKREKKEIVPFSKNDIEKFLLESKGDYFEDLYAVTLFTGMRIGEIMGLPWDAVDFENNTVTVKQQLLASRYKKISIPLIGPTKNGKSRVLTPPPFVMEILQNVRKKQNQNKIAAGALWQNEHNLVFTNEIGKHWSYACIQEHYKNIVTKIGRPDLRFHDLRHTYTVIALQEGVNPKTVQEALGHATANFTLDVYAHVSDKMRLESSSKLQAYYKKSF